LIGEPSPGQERARDCCTDHGPENTTATRRGKCAAPARPPARMPGRARAGLAKRSAGRAAGLTWRGRPWPGAWRRDWGGTFPPQSRIFLPRSWCRRPVAVNLRQRVAEDHEVDQAERREQAHADDPEALCRGASGFLLKNAPPEQLVNCRASRRRRGRTTCSLGNETQPSSSCATPPKGGPTTTLRRPPARPPWKPCGPSNDGFPTSSTPRCWPTTQNPPHCPP
jgi:hypothetical protein